MPKTNYRFLTLSLAGSLLCGFSFAQQTPAPSTNPPAASATTPAAPKTQKAPAAKAGTGATAAKKAPAPLVLKTQKDKTSYAIGMNIGKGLKENLKQNEIDIDPALLARGLKDALGDNKLLLTDEELKATLTALEAAVRKHQTELHDAAVAKNAKEGEAYLAANKDKPGVVALPSGLQYKILQEGTGPKPTATDTVECNYRGTLLNGTEFDSSYKRGKPAKFPVSGVIKGWTEALQLMPVGSKWQLAIPANLAYGEAGTPRGGPIGPNETLIFEVELLSIEPKAEAKPVTLQAPGGAPAAAATSGTQPQAAPQAPAAAKPQAATQAPSAAPTEAKPKAPPQAKPQ
jgi:FKBP-type peptidyl-prolyl cis-trans isomerase FklB